MYIERLFYKKSVEEVEINIATSFYWRNKTLNCISEFLCISVDEFNIIHN